MKAVNESRESPGKLFFFLVVEVLNWQRGSDHPVVGR
jgi:hypothetical protein